MKFIKVFIFSFCIFYFADKLLDKYNHHLALSLAKFELEQKQKEMPRSIKVVAGSSSFEVPVIDNAEMEKLKSIIEIETKSIKKLNSVIDNKSGDKRASFFDKVKNWIKF